MNDFSILIVTALVLTFFAVRSSYWLWKIFASAIWVAVWIYWINVTPIATITPGDDVDKIIVGVFILIPLALLMMPFWVTKNENGNEIARGFRVKMSRLIGSDQPSTRPPTRSERNAQYRERVNRAIRGER